MRNYVENGELCGIVRRTEKCAISHSPHLNVASALIPVNLSLTIRPYLSRTRDQIDPEHTSWFTVAVCSGCSLSARDCGHNEGC